VSLTEPQREQETLKTLQEARYVQGLDTCDTSVVAKLLRDSGLTAAADRLVAGDAELHQANAARVQRAQGLMHALGAQGVPTLVVKGQEGNLLLSGNVLYGSVSSLMGHIRPA
jgi:putative protein-disulfide isomerase